MTPSSTHNLPIAQPSHSSASYAAQSALQQLQQEVQFIRDIMLEMLQDIDSDVCHSFISLNTLLQQSPITSSHIHALQKELNIINKEHKTKDIIKAFSLYNMLINIVEERCNNKEQGAHNHLQIAYDSLLQSGFDKIAIDNFLESICFYPVFTAHPTESRRRTYLEAHTQIAMDLYKIFELGDISAHKAAKAHILYRLKLLWQTNLVRSQKIEVLFELDNVLFIVENSILPSSEKILSHIESILHRPLTRSPIVLGSWIGGDRDGNPFVTNGIMTEVMKTQHKLIITFYINKLKRLARELSIANDYVHISSRLQKSLQKELPLLDAKLAQGYKGEPFRAKLYIMIKKLQHRLILLNAPHATTHTYATPQELLHDTDMLIESMDAVSSTYLREFRRFVLLGGFHLMRLDFREHKDIFIHALSEILCLLGVCDNGFASYTEEHKITTLNAALERPKIALSILSEQVSAPTQQVIDIFLSIAWGKKYIHEDIIKTFILSMTTHASDLLCVLWFIKQTDLWKPSKRPNTDATKKRKKLRARIAITPLFETISDLHRASDIMKTLIHNPHYAHYLYDIGLEQEIMVGYSDSSKDGGIFASNYSLYGAIAELKALERDLGVEFILFHGRGGSVSRGGGSLESALLASPPRSVQGFLKTTEQGEVISSKYLNTSSAHFFLSSTIAALLKKTSHDIAHTNNTPKLHEPTNIIDPAPLASTHALDTSSNMHLDNSHYHALHKNPYMNAYMRYKPLLEHISRISYRTYRALVYENPYFLPYFKAATPIAFIQQLNLGSRPSKRKDTTTIEDLRAIPWVFAWTQNRAIIPAWYGLGSALSTRDILELQDCYAEVEFFAATISNISQAFLKADLSIAMHYNNLVSDNNVKESIWGHITSEYEKTLQLLLAIRKEDNLLDSEPILQQSIFLRSNSVMTLNLLQIELMQQYERIRPHHEAQRLRIMEQIHSTIIGIAQGLRNTG